MHAFCWTITADFEQGTLGTRADGPSGLTNANLSGGTLANWYDNTHVFSGSKAMKTFFKAGSTGSPGVAYSTGGQITFPSRITNGDEIWGRFYLYLPSSASWSWVCNPAVKVFRLAHICNSSGTGLGYVSVFNYWSGGSAYNNIAISNEIAGLVNNERITGSQFDYGQWQCIELYIKLSPVNGITRIWKNGILIREENQTRTTASPPFYPGYKTLSSSSDYADFAYVWTYWNGGAPQDQYAWIDDIKITTDPPPNLDAYGNRMIGPLGWAGSQTPPPPTGLEIIGP